MHLGENSLPVGEVVQAKAPVAAEEFLVGASCHSPEAAARAEREGADYIFFGPVFATPSKAAFGAPQGAARLAEVCRAVRIPVLAIGGITAKNAAACLEAGRSGIAAIRSVSGRVGLAQPCGCNHSSQGPATRRQRRASARGLPGRHVVADDLEHRRDGDRQNQTGRSPQPSPKQERNCDGDRVEMNAPPHDRGHQHVDGQQDAGRSGRRPRPEKARSSSIASGQSQTAAARKGPCRDRGSDSASRRPARSGTR